MEGRGQAAAPDVAELQDLRQFAKGSGRDPVELATYYRSLIEFSRIASEFEGEYPDNFVRAGVARTDSGPEYWLVLKREPVQEVRDKLGAFSGRTRITTGAPASTGEIAVVAGAIVSTLGNEGDGKYGRIGSRVSRDGRQMTIEYSLVADENSRPTDKERSIFEATSLQAGAKASTDGRLPMPVEFQALPPGRQITPSTTVQGGRTLFFGGGEHCTGGFTARRGSQNGILTARHCENALPYSNIAGIISTSPVGATNPPEGTIDLQWHATLTGNGHVTNDDFRATAATGGDRTVTSRADPVVGGYVCHWGRVSGYGCGEVIDTNDCYTYTTGITYCGIDRAGPIPGAIGDSGGPVFLTSTANGIWSGIADGEGFYTRISRVMSGLNATILGS